MTVFRTLINSHRNFEQVHLSKTFSFILNLKHLQKGRRIDHFTVPERQPSLYLKPRRRLTWTARNVEIIDMLTSFFLMIVISTTVTVRGQPSRRFRVEAWLPFRNYEIDYLQVLDSMYKKYYLFDRVAECIPPRPVFARKTGGAKKVGSSKNQ